VQVVRTRDPAVLEKLPIIVDGASASAQILSSF
jgi:uncharacterized UPF0160 family protein